MAVKNLTFEERKRTWLEISTIDEAQFDANWKFQSERQSGVPQPGDIAPDFELELLDKDLKRAGKTVQLSALKGKPVALMFGSYT
jgi:hypothetical protein